MLQSPTPEEIARAARLIRAGCLVAFPTETVYGLGANALDAEAVARIFAVKGRPATSPLIVHVASIEMAQSLAVDWPKTACLLAEKFWSGPLTLVVKKQSLVPDIVTAGLPTVGLRLPAHPVAVALIQAAGVPLAAPSANRFTELSPTRAEHVRGSLGNDVDMILDGGPCEIGIESTVLSLAEPQPVLLRPGGISRPELEAVIGDIAFAPQIPRTDDVRHLAGVAHPSPGMHARHYSPRTSLLLVSDGKLPEQGKGIYLQHTRPVTYRAGSGPPPANTNTLGHPGNSNKELINTGSANFTILQMPIAPADYAAALYDKLHQADEANADWIAVDLPPDTPEWEAVNDRLRRAATRE